MYYSLERESKGPAEQSEYCREDEKNRRGEEERRIVCWVAGEEERRGEEVGKRDSEFNHLSWMFPSSRYMVR